MRRLSLYLSMLALVVGCASGTSSPDDSVPMTYIQGVKGCLPDARRAIQLLFENRGEVPIAVLRDGFDFSTRGNSIAVFANPKTKTWTILLENADPQDTGVCVLAAGNGLELLTTVAPTLTIPVPDTPPRSRRPSADIDL